MIETHANEYIWIHIFVLSYFQKNKQQFRKSPVKMLTSNGFCCCWVNSFRHQLMNNRSFPMCAIFRFDWKCDHAMFNCHSECELEKLYCNDWICLWYRTGVFSHESSNHRQSWGQIAQKSNYSRTDSAELALNERKYMNVHRNINSIGKGNRRRSNNNKKRIGSFEYSAFISDTVAGMSGVGRDISKLIFYYDDGISVLVCNICLLGFNEARTQTQSHTAHSFILYTGSPTQSSTRAATGCALVC